MASKSIILAAIVVMILPCKFECLDEPSWIRAGYWYSGSALPVSDVNSELFTHLICGFAFINSSTHQISINSSQEQLFATFTDVVKRKNPTIITLLSILCGKANGFVFFSMIDQSSLRRSFIESSMRTARLYGFHGLDLASIAPSSSSNSTNLGTLLDEWRAAIESEARNSGKPRLLLVMKCQNLYSLGPVTYPFDSMQRNLDWVHVRAYDYHLPTQERFTGFHAALYDPSSNVSTDYSIKKILSGGLSASKVLLGLPYHGYGWQLDDPENNSVGALASGSRGSMGYKEIKSFIRDYGYGATSMYNATYVVNFFVVGPIWINFDGVEAIRTKVSYAKAKGLRGYAVFQISNDDNWELSRAARGDDEDRQNKQRSLIIIVLVTAAAVLLLGGIVFSLAKSKRFLDMLKRVLSNLHIRALSAEAVNGNEINMRVFSFKKIKAATDDFSSENKLGEGGFGPVYKGTLPNGLEIAVKRLSKTSHQGLEEFKNEVSLTAKLQHVNLARIHGVCTGNEEKMLIYEYMPRKSLELYLFDQKRRHLLDWRNRVNIIEGVTQGLLYLQEYSNFTIIHRDLKASNILLDNEMNPKISDFGIARLFEKDELEANTGRIVGTYGYVPPEYVTRGIYSMKYDVYSFGVLLLQIISGKRNNCNYGPNESLNFLEYAYELWKDGEGMEFIDPLLDDSSSPCKLMRCMQVALLCVQENPVDRPSMLEVSWMLKNETAAIKIPKKPAFSVNQDEASKFKEFSSLNLATISDVVARLFDATRSGDIAALEELLNEDPYILHSLTLNTPSNSPLHLSCLLGRVDFARLVMDRNKDLVKERNQQGFTPLHIASSKGHLEIVKDLLRINKEMCRVKDQCGRIALHCASIKGKTDVAQELIKAYPETASEKTTTGETVLHLAVINNQFEALEPMVGFLRDLKLDMSELFNSKDEFGQSILHLAVDVQNFQMVKLITSLNVDLTVINSANLTPLDLAGLRRTSDHTVDSKDIEDVLRAAAVGGGNYNRIHDHRIQITGTNSNQTSPRWASQSHGVMMAAVLLATLSFQAAINPPGGVWQDWGNSNSNTTIGNNPKQGSVGSDHLSIWHHIERAFHKSFPPLRDENRHMPGKSIARELYADDFFIFLISCSFCFQFSIFTILLIPLLQHVLCGRSISFLPLAMVFCCLVFFTHLFYGGIALVTDAHVPTSRAIYVTGIALFCLGLMTSLAILVQKLRKCRKCSESCS